VRKWDVQSSDVQSDKGNAKRNCAFDRLEVGTESSVDRSKSVKSHLMQLFEESGNSDILVHCLCKII